MEIVPAHGLAGFDSQFRIARFAFMQNIVLESDHRGGSYARKELDIGLAIHGIRIEIEQRFADRGVVKLGVLGEDRDVGTAQGKFIALRSGREILSQPTLLAFQ